MFLAYSLIATGGPPSVGGSSLILYLLGAALAGGGLPLVYQAMRNYRRAPLDDTQLISNTIQTQLGSMKGLLDEYRLELEVTKRQLEDYRKQLGDVTRELAEATVRISQLENRLEKAREGRYEIERELEQLRNEHRTLTDERERLVAETATLRERMAQLELIAGRDGGRDGGDISP